MPELPEVETVRRGLQQRTAGFAISQVLVHRARAIAAPHHDPEGFIAGLCGRQVLQWRRRGKYLLAELDQGHWGVHLRMTGQFLWLEAERSQAQPPCRHTRVQLWDQGGRELRFIDTRSFAEMWWVPPAAEPATVIRGLRRLGPEPFDRSFDAAYLHNRLQRSQRPIKTALLDQALVAGVGNIYADESLFAAGILPQTPSSHLSLERLHRLHGALAEVLQQSIGAGGTTFSDFRDLSGTNGNYGGMAWVYRRTGQPCRRCGTAINRTSLGGRSSHWCPGCQH
ncbi:MAG: DNA-formamidopyrimidine glycosylase [Cyanobacteria bacterium K_DeepCast_35m_m2_023]|nr:DNA-formamidopyrimidine glycosylase [Cyanobacteria bacterium K_DeepCast_35m_m2_023]